MRRQTSTSQPPLSQLRIFARKATWEEQLRQTNALGALQRAAPDEFPLALLQDITDAFLRSTVSPSSGVLRRVSIAPLSIECDILLSGQLAAFRGEMFMWEVGILACLHAFTADQARGWLFALRPDDANPDEFFDRRMSVCLQVIVLARKANHEACTSEEAKAAEELLAVVTGRIHDFPSIRQLLRAVGDGTCDLLLPVSLISISLKRSHYRENIRKELDSLRRERKWFAAYKLVSGLRHVTDIPRADALLRDTFPEYPMWAVWRPNPRRIMAWESPRLSPFRGRIGPILDLEGPDVTGQQLGTLRMSSPGAFITLVSPAYSSDRHLLDRMLDVLDACLGVGDEALAMFVYVCVDLAGVSDMSLQLIESVLELRDDAATKIFSDFLRVTSSDSSTFARLHTFSAAFSVMQSSAQLQKVYGMFPSLAASATATLSEAQRLFCEILEDDNVAEQLGLQIQVLGKLMLQATWLHDMLLPAYVDMLQSIPTEIEVRSTFSALRTLKSTARETQLDLLAARLGASYRRDHPSSVIRCSDSIYQEA